MVIKGLTMKCYYVKLKDWLAHKIEIDGLYTEERDWTTKISCTIE